AFITAPGEALPAVEVAAGPPREPPVRGAPTPDVVVAAAPLPTAPAPAAAAPPAGFILASPAARRLAKEKGLDLALVHGSGADGMVIEADVTRFLEENAQAAEVLATSAARKLAAQRGLDLAEVPGSGIGGRITEQDVLTFEARAKTPVAPAGVAKPPARTVPFAGMRQAIAEHMVESLHTMAQLTMMMEVDVTELVQLREQVKADFEVTYTDLLVKAVAKTLKSHPLLNVVLIGDEIQLLDCIHIGVAVALPDGLIVPVVRDADKLTVREIAQEVRHLAQGAREGTLSVDEVAGSTFTITNLGNYGLDGFTPIINAPEAAILGVGRIAERVVVHDDQIARRKMMTLSLTIDHRLVDGAPGAEFLRSLQELLQNPYRLLV
ncbi:MAG: 2-oxo acid dehydrogenase subunit E2, partial [Chloroflexota bacterium]|nr:2-oxo acid dehydrogenase subunit E2 [Chloroflexota bacterium]